MKYAFRSVKANWYDANEFCKSTFGGQLATASEVESFVSIQEVAQANAYWIGASHDNVHSSESSEAWTWLNTSKTVGWFSGQAAVICTSPFCYIEGQYDEQPDSPFDCLLMMDTEQNPLAVPGQGGNMAIQDCEKGKYAKMQRPSCLQMSPWSLTLRLSQRILLSARFRRVLILTTPQLGPHQIWIITSV